MKKSLFALALVACALAAVTVGVSSGVAAAGRTVAVCGTLGEEDGVAADLVSTGRFATVDKLGCDSATPSLATLQSYDAVYAWPDDSYPDMAATAQNLADYVNSGGTLVTGQWGFASCCGTWWGTVLDTGGYLPFTNAGAPQDSDPAGSGGTKLSAATDITILDAASPLLAGVSSVPYTGDEYGAVSVAPGATEVAAWNDPAATPFEAFKGNVVAINDWLVDGDSGDWLTVLANALDWGTPTHVIASLPRAGYCAAAGNYNPETGEQYAVGQFLDLQGGQPTNDPAYKGATPAKYVEGIGITCDNVPSGYVQDGYATAGDYADGFYPYFKKG